MCERYFLGPEKKGKHIFLAHLRLNLISTDFTYRKSRVEVALVNLIGMATGFRDESTGKEFDSLLYILGFKKKDAKGFFNQQVDEAIDLATNDPDPCCRVSAVVTVSAWNATV